jgi:parvulin-like peptidyl-prolyl isomerase
MDAPLGRRRLAASLVAALLMGAGGTGCGMLGQEADRQADDSFADPSLPVRRAQSPDGPRAPAVLPPAVLPPADKLTLPVPARPPAAVVPAEAAPPAAVVPVSATDPKPAADKASSAVRPIATVGADNFISDEEVSMMMKQRAMDYIMLKGDERVKKEKEVYKEELKKLIDRELILTEFLGRVKKNNPGALPQLWEEAGKIADSQMRQRRQAFNIKSEAELAVKLGEQGIDYKLFRRQIERQALVNMFLNTILKDKGGTPTLAQVQDYYARHADEYKSDDKVKFQHLFVSNARFDTPDAAKRRAEELFAAARGGADFLKLVKEHGHGDSVLRGGAGVGEKRGEIQPPELEKVIWDIKPGNFSGVLPSENGFHVIRVLEREVAGVRQLDEKLQTEIRNKLADQSTKAEVDKLTAQLWRQIGVTIVEER